MKVVFEDKTMLFRKSYFDRSGDYVTMKNLLKFGEIHGNLE